MIDQDFDYKLVVVAVVDADAVVVAAADYVDVCHYVGKSYYLDHDF